MAHHMGGEDLSLKDFQDLLKVLKIQLPKGILNEEVVSWSRGEAVISDAKSIIKELEKFELEFGKIPRLACTKVGQALGKMKQPKEALEITKIVFFNKPKDSKNCQNQWKSNVSKTVSGFRMRRTYQTTEICTPVMKKPSRSRQQQQENQATITKGKAVTENNFLESPNMLPLCKWNFNSRKYNQRTEGECLKFIRQLKKDEDQHNKTYQVSYSKGNKVEYGFLLGYLDFLGINRRGSSIIQKTIIECKSTRGHMVGKVLTIPNDGCVAELKAEHEYYFQTLTYRYILQKVESNPDITVRAVMVVRHEEKGKNPKFYWNDVEENSEQIDKLRRLCEEEALPRFLAILNLIFEKQTNRKKRHVKQSKQQTFLKN